jgi:hypothetical protein
MSGATRLASARAAWLDDFSLPNTAVEGLAAADPLLLRDIEDGEALRLLLAALPDGWDVVVRNFASRWGVEVWDPYFPPTRDDPPQPRYLEIEETVAEAADKARAAIEAR